MRIGKNAVQQPLWLLFLVNKFGCQIYFMFSAVHYPARAKI